MGLMTIFNIIAIIVILSYVGYCLYNNIRHHIELNKRYKQVKQEIIKKYKEVKK